MSANNSCTTGEVSDLNYDSQPQLLHTTGPWNIRKSTSRKTGPPSNHETQQMKAMLANLENFPVLWKSRRRYPRNHVEEGWKHLAKLTTGDGDDNLKMKKLYKKVTDALKYRINKAKITGIINQFIQEGQENNELQKLYQAHTYEFWFEAEYLTKDILLQNCRTPTGRVPVSEGQGNCTYPGSSNQPSRSLPYNELLALPGCRQLPRIERRSNSDTQEEAPFNQAAHNDEAIYGDSEFHNQNQTGFSTNENATNPLDIFKQEPNLEMEHSKSNEILTETGTRYGLLSYEELLRHHTNSSGDDSASTSLNQVKDEFDNNQEGSQSSGKQNSLSRFLSKPPWTNGVNGIRLEEESTQTQKYHDFMKYATDIVKHCSITETRDFVHRFNYSSSIANFLVEKGKYSDQYIIANSTTQFS